MFIGSPSHDSLPAQIAKELLVIFWFSMSISENVKKFHWSWCINVPAYKCSWKNGVDAYDGDKMQL